ncbi:MAG: NPCBM/NEW2 domain-containing protein [Bythopirellula sp.]
MTDIKRHPSRYGICALLVLPALTWTAWGNESSLVVTTVDGSRLRGELVTWDAAELTLGLESGTLTIAAADMLRMEWSSDQATDQSAQQSTQQSTPFVELTDGTRLPLTNYVAKESQASITTPLRGQPLNLPTKQIEYVQLQPDAPQRDEIEQEIDGDLLVVRKKSSGRFDFLTGVIGNASEEQVHFTWDGEAIPVRRDKVAALLYFHVRKPQHQEPACWLTLSNGARLPVAELTLERSAVSVRTPGGLALDFSRSLLIEADYSAGKLAYLSDLQPIEQRWIPRIGLPKTAELIRQHGLPRRDQSFAGSALSLRWPASRTGALDSARRTYAKGLAIRSRTKLRYRIPPGMTRFVTLAGIDPETAQQGNVTLEIFGDRRSLWQGEIAGGTEPTAISVSLGGARHLRIVVDYGRNLDFGDRLHLAEARLSR